MEALLFKKILALSSQRYGNYVKKLISLFYEVLFTKNLLLIGITLFLSYVFKGLWDVLGREKE